MYIKHGIFSVVPQMRNFSVFFYAEEIHYLSYEVFLLKTESVLNLCETEAMNEGYALMGIVAVSHCLKVILEMMADEWWTDVYFSDHVEYYRVVLLRLDLALNNFEN